MSGCTMVVYTGCISCCYDCQCHHVHAVRGDGQDAPRKAELLSEPDQCSRNSSPGRHPVDATGDRTACPGSRRIHLHDAVRLFACYIGLSYHPSDVCIRCDCVHTTVLPIVCVSTAVYTTEVTRQSTKRKSDVVEIDTQVVLHTSEHRRLSVCRLDVVYHTTDCTHPLL